MNTPGALFPVHNAQRHLEADVAELLEVLSESAGSFELVILDDGSTDETPEVTSDLAARYPQIRVIRHPLRLGLAEAIQTGLDHMHGPIMLVGDEDYCGDSDDLRTLWKLRDAQWRRSRRGDGAEPWIQRLLAWKSRAGGARRGFQFVSRQSFDQIRMGEEAEIVPRVDAPQNATLAIARRLKQPKLLYAAAQFTQDN